MKNFTVEDPCLLGIDSGDVFNFKCKYCARNLSSRQNLREHIFIHTGERPYKCTEVGCTKSFRQGSLLSIHRKTHKKQAEKLKACKKIEKSVSYLKLTDIFLDNPDFPLSQMHKSFMIEEIGETDYNFAEKFLKKMQFP